MRRRLALLSGAASDVRESVRRARARRRFQAGTTPAEQRSAAEIKRRLDETRRRLKSEIPPLEDHE